MKRNLLLTFALMALGVLPASAQITITANEIDDDFFSTLDQVMTTFSTTEAASNQGVIEDLVDADGGNQEWDFTELTFGSGTVFESEGEVREPSAELPGGDIDEFLNADFVVIGQTIDATSGEVTDTYSYMSVENDGVYFHGSVSVGNADEDPDDEVSVFRYEPAWLFYRLPLTFETEWDYVGTVTFTPDGEEEASFEYDIHSVVDGWGELKTPHGSADALRIHETTSTTIEIPDFGEITTTSESIEFITEEDISAYLSYPFAPGQPYFAGYTVEGDFSGTPVENPGETPDRFALDQNYPNPFNPETTIPFELATPAHVQLSIYDVQGREVGTLIDGQLPAGTHSAAWDASGLASGPYLYRLQVDGQTLTRTMVLQK